MIGCSTCRNWSVLIAAALLACLPGLPAHAQKAVDDVVLCRMGASAGARTYRGGLWGLVEVYAINQTDEGAEAQAVLRFNDDPTLQYGRRLYVPARSQLRTSCPVLVPDFAASRFSIDFVTEQTFPQVPSTSRTQRDVVLAPQSRLLNNETVNAGIIADLSTSYPSRDDVEYFGAGDENVLPVDQPVYEMLLAAKRARRLSRRVSVLAPNELPADAAGLAILDVIALATNSVTADPGGLAVLRDWVLGGGTLWIPLDRITSDTAFAVLGDAFDSTVVDRIRLGRLQISSARPDLDYRGRESLELDTPADFARVLPGRQSTLFDTIDGWPAAYWIPFGAGRVCFTTIGSDAWMRPTLLTDPPAITPDDFTLFFPREPLQYFAAEILRPRAEADLTIDVLRPFLSEQIGYRIIKAPVVAGILAAFCGMLGIACAWQYRIGRGERLLWLAPLIACAATAVFGGLAYSTKRAVPPTSAAVSRVIFESGSSTGHEFGLAAMYNPRSSQAPLGATQGGVFFPDMTSMTGRTRRVTWTDEGQWHWEQLELPAGVRVAPFTRPMSLDAPVDCQATFGPRGLEGSLTGIPFQGIGDAVVAFSDQPAIAVNISDNGEFVAEAGGELADDSYVTGSLLSDEQRRRSMVYRELFDRLEGSERSEPVLYAWAEQVDRGFEFPQTNQFGSSLFSVPLRIEAAAPGATVLVPPSFIRYRAVRDPRGALPTAYGNMMGEWVESTNPAADWIRFQLPQAVLPMRIDQAVISLNVRAPSRTVQLAVPVGDRLESIRRFSRPIGSYRVVLDRAELLNLDDDGGLLVVVQVSDDESSASVGALADAPWKIESLQLQIMGVVEGEADAE